MTRTNYPDFYTCRLAMLLVFPVLLSFPGLKADAPSAEAALPWLDGLPPAVVSKDGKLKPAPAYIESVDAALNSKTDLWGEQALALPDGPTYESLAGHLTPVMHLFKWYSESEVIYLPFGMQDGVTGGTDYALHYADGGQIVSRRSESPPTVIPPGAPAHSGKRLTIFVGPEGKERYGSALARLPLPRLGEGYLPILQTRYSDAAGIAYTQESFAARIPQTAALVSFIRLTAQRGRSAAATAQVRLRFTAVAALAIKDEPGLRLSGNNLLDGQGKVFAVISGGEPVLKGAELSFKLDLADGQERELYVMRLNNPAPVKDGAANAKSYQDARQRVVEHWNTLLAKGASFEVPEPYAMHAMKNLLIQNLQMNYLYSIGNAYETIYNAEAHDALRSLGLFGFLAEYKAGVNILAKGGSANYEKGERLLHAADYYFLTHDRSLLDENHGQYEKFAAAFSQEMAENNGLLRQEQGGTDISGSTLHYNAHHQCVAWRGWRDMACAWRQSGRKDLADGFAAKIDLLQKTLVQEMAVGEHPYPDGAVYIPLMLRGTGDPGPFEPLCATKEGAYWLLVATDGFATGILPPEKNRAILNYLHNHGGIMMGMIRFNYLSTPVGETARNGLPGYETPGMDNAYMVPYVQFLADNGLADRLALSFYGKLAHGMSRDTFLAGEGENVGVNRDPKFAYGTPFLYYRTSYLPPNSTNNAAYLWALRYLLIRETQDPSGMPQDLLLAEATPRAWLADGKTIRVSKAPTFYGPLSYELHSQLAQSTLEATIQVPDRDPIRALRLRLRTPGHRAMRGVTLNGKKHEKFDPADESLDLSGQTGTLKLRVQ